MKWSVLLFVSFLIVTIEQSCSQKPYFFNRSIANIKTNATEYKDFLVWLKDFIYTKFVFYDTIIADNNIELYEPVIRRLENDDIPSDIVYAVYSDYRISLQDRLVNMNIHYQESADDYAHNLEDWAIEQANEFLLIWFDELEHTEQLYGVPKEIITAILWVETKCGQILGDHLAVNVFSTLAMLTEPEQMDRIREKVAEYHPEDNFEELIPRINRKASWGYSELLILFKLSMEREYFQLLELRGSWAGAFGLCQFLPSSYRNSAVDGDGDGRVDLFMPIDAFHSVGNYLRKSGWNSADYQSQRQAIRSYNHSTYYINTVLELASRFVY